MGELRCSGRVSFSCSTSGTLVLIIKVNPEFTKLSNILFSCFNNSIIYKMNDIKQ